MKRDLTRTIEALAAFDTFSDQLDAMLANTTTNKEVNAAFYELERLGEAVGYAFGLDTSDINNPEHCRSLRPGPRQPAPGFELSFIRRMIEAYRKEKRSNKTLDAVSIE